MCNRCRYDCYDYDHNPAILAVTSYRYAKAMVALPASCLLGFSHADHLETRGNSAAATAIYDGLLEKVAESNVSLVYIQYLKFLRRTVSVSVCARACVRACVVGWLGGWVCVGVIVCVSLQPPLPPPFLVLSWTSVLSCTLILLLIC